MTTLPTPHLRVIAAMVCLTALGPLATAACDAPSPVFVRSPARPPARPAAAPSSSLLASGDGGVANLDPANATEGPVLAPAPPPAIRPPGAYANIDPTDDEIVAPPDALPDCEEQLARAGVVYRTAQLAVHTEHKTLLCGAPQVVTYLRGPGKIVYEPAPLLTCSMALALASFERIVQEEAEREFHSPVVKVVQLGTYSCRMIAAYPGWVSEHSYANAIDLSKFTLRNGKTIEVYRDFDMSDDPPAKHPGAFLRQVSRRAYDEEVFSHVLTPFFNAQHRNHFHLDLARYRGDGTRPET
jgi:hypothetical protein